MATKKSTAKKSRKRRSKAEVDASKIVDLYKGAAKATASKNKSDEDYVETKNELKAKLDALREKLSPIKRFVWDIAVEDLESEKAASQHSSMMDRLLQFERDIEAQDPDAVVKVELDTVATSEVFEDTA